jgi:hypothetical protein
VTSPYVFLAQPIPVLAKQVILQDYVAFHLKARPYVFDCKYESPSRPTCTSECSRSSASRGPLRQRFCIDP